MMINKQTQIESNKLRNYYLIGGLIAFSLISAVTFFLFKKSTKDKVIEILFREQYNNIPNKFNQENFKNNKRGIEISKCILEAKFWYEISGEKGRKNYNLLNEILKTGDKEENNRLPLVDWFNDQKENLGDWFNNNKQKTNFILHKKKEESILALTVYIKRRSLFKKCAKEMKNGQAKYLGLKEKLENFEKRCNVKYIEKN